MRRFVTVIALGVVTVLVVGSPALAYFHNGVADPTLHAVLDLLTLALVSAPILTVHLWRTHMPYRERKRGLLALLLALQVPAAVLAFTTFLDPVAHAAGSAASLALTATSLWLAWRWVPAPDPEPETERIES